MFIKTNVNGQGKWPYLILRLSGRPISGITSIPLGMRNDEKPDLVQRPGLQVSAAKWPESSEAGGSAKLFVVCPHANNFYLFFFINDLINNPVLNIYSS